MYHNRMRSVDFEQVFQDAGYRVRHKETAVDPRAMESLNSGFPVHSAFGHHSPEEMATTYVKLVATPV
jgi:hypothetical protein